MKTLALLCALTLSTASVAVENTRPDFLARNVDGSIRIRGVYEADTQGRVLKYTVYDGAGRHQYTEIPYYSPDGRIIRGDHLSADGKILKVVVYFEKIAKVFDAKGELLDIQSFSQQDFLSAVK